MKANPDNYRMVLVQKVGESDEYYVVKRFLFFWFKATITTNNLALVKQWYKDLITGKGKIKAKHFISELYKKN